MNWEKRFKNPIFWVNIAVSVAMPVLAYYGLKAEDLTTWNSLLDLLKQAFSNPYVLGTMLVSIYTTIVNPTTKGVLDNE